MRLNARIFREDTKDIIPERFRLVQPKGSHVFLLQVGPGGESPLVRLLLRTARTYP